MKEKFIFLTSVSDLEYNLVCQRLKQAGIKYKLNDRLENAPLRLYGAQSLLSAGKMIFVPVFELEKAKKLLGLKK